MNICSSLSCSHSSLLEHNESANTLMWSRTVSSGENTGGQCLKSLTQLSNTAGKHPWQEVLCLNLFLMCSCGFIGWQDGWHVGLHCSCPAYLPAWTLRGTQSHHRSQIAPQINTAGRKYIVFLPDYCSDRILLTWVKLILTVCLWEGWGTINWRVWVGSCRAITYLVKMWGNTDKMGV